MHVRMTLLQAELWLPIFYSIAALITALRSETISFMKASKMPKRHGARGVMALREPKTAMPRSPTVFVCACVPYDDCCGGIAHLGLRACVLILTTRQSVSNVLNQMKRQTTKAKRIKINAAACSASRGRHQHGEDHDADAVVEERFSGHVDL